MHTLEVPDRELDLRRQLEPVIAGSYERHMTRGEKVVGDEENGLPIEYGVLDPLTILNRAVGLDMEDGLTPELVLRVRTSADTHYDKLREKGVDLRPVVHLGAYIVFATEVNLPWYHGDQLPQALPSPAYRQTLGRWTAEEAPHAPLTEYVASMGGIMDQKARLRVQTKQLMTGMHVEADSYAGIFPYTDPQEGSTNDTQQNLGFLMDEVGRDSMSRIGGQEIRHQRLFRRIVQGIVKIDPEYTLPIIARQWSKFDMPGKEGIEHFTSHATMLAVHGIFTRQMIRDHMRASAEDSGMLKTGIVSTPEAIEAQKTIQQLIDGETRLDELANRKIARATEQYIADCRSKGIVPVILGQTVVFNTETKELDVFPEAA